MSESKIPAIIVRLYSLVDELEALFPERKFTLDGHLVGSIGEVAAKYFYNLNLLSISSASSDATTLDEPSQTVQIKLTAGNSVSLAEYESHPNLLIVLRIDRKLGFDEVYNGPYPIALLASKKVTKRQVRTLSVQQLRACQSNTKRSLDDQGRIAILNAGFAERAK
ncbi:MAG: hypothetical protein ABSG96_01535 [Terracidiphilus sp.]|jgi:hypothetical protein